MGAPLLLSRGTDPAQRRCTEQHREDRDKKTCQEIEVDRLPGCFLVHALGQLSRAVRAAWESNVCEFLNDYRPFQS
jgi:hypothetical protein